MLGFDQPDWNTLADEARVAMTPSSNDGVSFLNTIIEAKDWKRMNPIPALENLYRKHPTLSELRGSKRLRRKFYKRTVKRLNNAYLNASFGVIPTVSDAVRIHDTLSTMAVRLEALRREAGVRQQRHFMKVLNRTNGSAYRSTWSVVNTNTPGWVHPVRSDLYGGGFRPNIRVTKMARWEKRPTYHATMRFSYTLPPLGDTMTRVLYYLDQLGVRFDPSIVWNAIPFSFVVDWVVDIGSWLQQFARNNLSVDIIVHEFCHSVSWAKEYELWIWYPDDPHPTIQNPNGNWGRWNGRGDNRVYRGTRKSYTRYTSNPGYSTTVRPKALTLTQVSLAGSLLGARALGSTSKYRVR